jgi:predicted TIM-barrel fold metal-dependent hydrolase
VIIDFQHHYIPWSLAERHGARRGAKVNMTQDGVAKFTLHDRVYDLEQQLRDLALAGMDMAVLSCPVGWDAPLEDCQLINDEFAAVQAKYPDQFAGLAHVPVHEGKAALRELDRAIGDLGLRGVTVMSQIKGAPLDTRDFWDFFAKAVELDIPIFVHPPLAPQGYVPAVEYDLLRIIAREFDLALAATRLIAGGVLEAFPTLKVVIAHFGGGVAAVKERLRAKAYRFGTKRSRSFDEDFDLLYFDMAGFEGGPAALQSALTGIKPERLVFATDYPQDFTGQLTDTGKGVGDIRRYIQDVRDLKLPAEAKEAILGGTAARLLKPLSRRPGREARRS